jgi:hypothetical protein
MTNKVTSKELLETKDQYTVCIPPTAATTAAIPVRIPGNDVQNDLLPSPIANFTFSHSDNIS